MSRCFPYPPPGYSLSKATNDALIESIKLQKEREKDKARAERKKEKKREKKEKQKDAKSKAEVHCGNIPQQKFQEDDKPWLNGKNETTTKQKTLECNQVERSSLTEEHTLPVPSNSSDSTENSNKRKRNLSPRDGNRVYGRGNIIRIRLSSQKQIVNNSSCGDQVCSTSGRTETPAPYDNELTLRAGQDDSCRTLQGGSVMQALPSISGQLSSSIFKLTKKSGANNVQTAGVENIENPLHGLELQYKDLLEKWTPACFSSYSLDDDDEEWLLGRKHQDRSKKQRGTDIRSCSSTSVSRASDGQACCSTSVLWSRAVYLPDSDIHALPFTIPF